MVIHSLATLKALSDFNCSMWYLADIDTQAQERMEGLTEQMTKLSVSQTVKVGKRLRMGGMNVRTCFNGGFFEWTSYILHKSTTGRRQEFPLPFLYLTNRKRATIGLHSRMLFILCTHSKALTDFNCSVIPCWHWYTSARAYGKAHRTDETVTRYHRTVKVGSALEWVQRMNNIRACAKGKLLKRKLSFA